MLWLLQVRAGKERGQHHVLASGVAERDGQQHVIGGGPPHADA